MKKICPVFVILILLLNYGFTAFSNAEIGVTESEITFGSSLALEGHAGYLGTQTLQGASVYLTHINENGGIHGRKITLISYDDGYDPERCIQNTNKLIHEDRVFGLFCFVGTPTSVKIIPIVEEAKIPLVGLFTGAELLRNPVKPHIFNIRASYYQETAGIVDRLWKDRGLRSFAVFYQNDVYGESGLKGVELALESYGSKPVATGSYERGSEDIGAALESIRQAKPEAVIMIGVYSPCARFIQSAKWSGFNPYFHNVSFVGANKLAYLLGSGRDSDGVIVTQVVPPPESELPGVVEYRELLKKYGGNNSDAHNFVALEGFLNAKILVEILNRIGRDVTRQKFIQAAESVKEFDVGFGYPVTFGTDDHQGLDAIYFTLIKNGKYELITNWDTLK